MRYFFLNFFSNLSNKTYTEGSKVFVSVDPTGSASSVHFPICKCVCSFVALFACSEKTIGLLVDPICELTVHLRVEN